MTWYNPEFLQHLHQISIFRYGILKIKCAISNIWIQMKWNLIQEYQNSNEPHCIATYFDAKTRQKWQCPNMENIIVQHVGLCGPFALTIMRVSLLLCNCQINKEQGFLSETNTILFISLCFLGRSVRERCFSI